MRAVRMRAAGSMVERIAARRDWSDAESGLPGERWPSANGGAVRPVLALAAAAHTVCRAWSSGEPVVRQARVRSLT
jgi:hypothetical protein